MRVVLSRAVVAVGAIGLVVAAAVSLSSSDAPRPAAVPATTEVPNAGALPASAQAVRVRVPVVAAAGDIATDGSTDSATARLVRRMNPRFVLTLGDMAYPKGTRSAYRRFYEPTWGTFKGRTRPAPGNHEYLPGTGSPHFYFRYFARQLPNRHHGQYYAFNVGRWRLYSLNCEITCGAHSRQARWLRRDLARRGAGRHKLAYLHRPRYSCGKHGSSRLPDALWNRLQRARTDIVLAGHDHNYQRYPRMNSDDELTRSGILSFVVGTGGAIRYHITGQEHTQGCGKARFVQSHRYGVLKLSLGPQRFHWAFVTPHHNVLDSGTRRTLRQR
jgi:hypothetical protein